MIRYWLRATLYSRIIDPTDVPQQIRGYHTLNYVFRRLVVGAEGFMRKVERHDTSALWRLGVSLCGRGSTSAPVPVAVVF